MSSSRRYNKHNQRRLISNLLIASLTMCGVVLIVGGVFVFIGLPPVAPTSQFEHDVFRLINNERQKQGIPALRIDANLELIAKSWSNELAEKRQLTHGNFEQRIASIGYSQYFCGEIIAVVTIGSVNVAQEFVDGWIHSPGHYQIMMTAAQGYMGVGIARNVGGFYAVVDFRFT